MQHMAEKPTQRRLAAILAADVVGYARLMEQDEAGTLATLKSRRRSVLEPLVARHRGRVFKFTGDGVLVEFGSAVNAVQCAVDLQERMATANSEQPDESPIVLRIGVNLGDVLIEGSDLYGDGINIAARLEGLAEPGGILVSGTAYDHVRNKVKVGFEDLGAQTVKNIAEPVRTYRVQLGAVTAGTRPTLALPDKPSIAVLPFQNMSGDPEQQYFSDGMTEDIITELSRFRSLLIIARNSSFLYRDKAVDVRRIGSELGARYLVQGSVRRLNDRVRITAQLIDAIHGNHLWSEKFDRSIEDLFDVQDEVTQTIVATITGRIEDTEIRSATTRRKSSLPAYDCLLRGVAHLRGYGPHDNRLARELFEEATALDPNFALAKAYLGLSLLVEDRYAVAPQAVKDRAVDLASTAVRLDPRESRCHLFLGQAFRFSGKFDLAVSHTEQSLKLNPGDANGMAYYGSVLTAAGRAEEGLDVIRRAMRLDPYHPAYWWGSLASSLFHTRRYEEALDANAKVDRSRNHWHLARDAACLSQLGRLDEARAVAAEVLRLKPGFCISTELPKFKREEDADHLREALRKAGLPE
jgi:adenylate cyclase